MNQVVFRSYLSNSFSRRRRADLAGEDAARDVVGRVLAAVGAQPPGDRVDVDADHAEDLLGHRSPPDPWWYNAKPCARSAGYYWRSTGPSGKAAGADARFRVALLNRVLDHFGLRLDDWSGRVYVLRDRKGRSVVVANLGALWVEAERLVGAPLDPLDPGLVRALA